MKYLVKEDFSYERRMGSDTEDPIIATANSWEEAEQIIGSYDRDARRFMYIEEEWAEGDWVVGEH